MDFSHICRTCLDTKHLNPIFKEGGDHDSFSNIILATTGLKIECNDGLPQQMCLNCIKSLKDTLKFRKTCKDAEIQLHSIKIYQYRENQSNDSKKKLRREKTPKNIKNDTFVNVKIEPDFRNDAHTPLLQQKLSFTTKQKNVEMESVFVKINEIQDDGDLVKNEDENKLDVNSESVDQKVGNELEIENDFAENERVFGNVQEIVSKSNDGVSDKIKCEDETGLEANDAKYETEFLDPHFDSDMDEYIKNDVVLTNYHIDIPDYHKDNLNDNTTIFKHDMQYPESSMETQSEANNSNVNNCNQTGNNKEYQIYFTMKMHNKQTKHLEKEEDPQKYLEDMLFNNSEVKDNSQKDNGTPLTKNLEIGIKSQIDAENLNCPFIVRSRNRVTCKLCQKDLSRRSVGPHMASKHPGADMRKVKCELCNIYVLRERLNRHKVVAHGLNCFRCGYCKTEHDSKEALIDHVAICTSKKRKRNKRKEVMVQCDICNKLMQQASLRMHKEVKHAGMGPVCEHCGRRFSNKYRLSEHLRAKHGYEKFKCSVCDFLSASAMAIRNHERRHRGEKPYVCEQCGAKFHAPHLLAQHKQSHRTEKNMKCDQCPAAFKANNTLHMHKMTCHNTTTYQCSICPRLFSARHYALKHLRSVHRHSGPAGALLVGPKEPHTIDTESLKNPTISGGLSSHPT